MTAKEIESYLAIKHIQIDGSVGEEIERLRQDAICAQNEYEANYFWSLSQVYRIQQGFLSAINALKKHKFEEAWRIFDHIDIELSF